MIRSNPSSAAATCHPDSPHPVYCHDRQWISTKNPLLQLISHDSGKPRTAHRHRRRRRQPTKADRRGVRNVTQDDFAEKDYVSLAEARERASPVPTDATEISPNHRCGNRSRCPSREICGIDVAPVIPKLHGAYSEIPDNQSRVYAAPFRRPAVSCATAPERAGRSPC